jgi:hypothetical protein
MSLLFKEQASTRGTFEATSVTPLEKAYLKSPNLDLGLEFFDGECMVHVANQPALRRKAYELIHDLYAEIGYTRKKANGLWLSIHDALPETTTFVAANGAGGIEGTLTIVFDSPIGLPADELYKKEIDAIRNCDTQLCEIKSLGLKNKGKNSLKYLAALFYCAFLHSWQSDNSDTLVITVHSRSESFYCKRICFEKTGPVRNYPKVNWIPAVLLSISLDKLDGLRHQKRVFPFYLFDFADQKELDLARQIKNGIRPLSDEEFFTFFVDKTDTWEKATQSQKCFIKDLYSPGKTNHDAAPGALRQGI